MLSRQVIAVNGNSGIYTWDDLAGKTVAVQSTGKPEELFLSGKYSGFPNFAEVISVEERGVQYAALDCGYVDAIASHEMAIRQYIEDYETNFRVLEKPVLVTAILFHRAASSRLSVRNLHRSSVSFRKRGRSGV